MEAVAKLRNVRISPRKMRLVAGLVRGREVSTALELLKHEPKKGAAFVEKLLLSAAANWENKNADDEDLLEEIANLKIKEIFVDAGKMLKRIQPAPQGRAHRVRKRSCHVTVVVDLPKDAQSEAMTAMAERIAGEVAAQAELLVGDDADEKLSDESKKADE
ncbi:MAG: 50S ribosomal protein L22 [Bernardetiaceae bacterium]|nr:50S ribosomal protein L22 [Bernardetiaceae bacterium]